MEKNKLQAKRLQRRKYGIRKTLFGTQERPRLSVFRSNKHIYAQIINDYDGRTLVSASSVEKDVRSQLPDGGDIAAASEVGKRIAEKAKGAGISAVAFDRNGRKFHGRIKALAEGAREGGLQF